MTTESRIREILRDPFQVDWSIQGLGMLRAYLDEDGVERLHIWDPAASAPEVSTIHDHPWDFTSRVVFGHLRNQRYLIDVPDGADYIMAKLHCGVGGGLIESPRRTRITAAPPEWYGPESTYSQLAPEFHESYPTPGTVTVIRRTFHEDRDIATVCWKSGEWGSAEPRPATPEEIHHFVSLVKMQG